MENTVLTKQHNTKKKPFSYLAFLLTIFNAILAYLVGPRGSGY